MLRMGCIGLGVLLSRTVGVRFIQQPREWSESGSIPEISKCPGQVDSWRVGGARVCLIVYTSCFTLHAVCGTNADKLD